MKRFDIVVFDGVDELDALGPLEVLRGAAKRGAELTVRLVTRVHQEHVIGAHGLRFVPNAVFEPGAADVVIVTGGGWGARADVGAWGEAERGDLLPVLRAAAAASDTMASVCTGAMLLAHAGVIGTRPATTHHSAIDELAATGATVRSERVVDDGDLVTAGGVTSGIDLALWLVEREFSRDVAERVAANLEHPLLPAPARPAVADELAG